MASLSESFLANLKSFGDVRSRLGATEFDIDQSESLKRFDDEFGRLRLWASNIGAHQKGQSSLDFRLRDASNIRDQIGRLLDDLRDTLQDAEEFLDELGSGSDINDSGGGIDKGNPESELEQICQSIVTCVDCLFQMSIIVRKPARHDFIRSPLPAEILSYQGFYEGYIKDKFPNAEKKTADRLAFAMMRRKHFLGYRERHRAKLANGLDTTDDSLSQTVATNERVVEYVDGTQSEAGTSTSFASEMLVSGDITMPPLPSEATNGKPFECPYCYVVISVKGLRSWYKHVFEDIRPYVCIVPECTTPAVLFSSRRKWTQHLQDSHSKVWWDSKGRKDLQRASKPAARCLICFDEAESETQLIRHLSKHMQEIALFSLPRPEDSFDEAEAEDGDDTSDEGEEVVLSNKVDVQELSPSLDRTHESHIDMEEFSDDSRESPLRDRRSTHHSRTPSPQYDSETERRLHRLGVLEENESRLRDRRSTHHSRTSSPHYDSETESRTPSPHYSSETERRLQRLKALEESEEKFAAEERAEEELILKEAREARKVERRLEEEQHLERRAIEIKKLDDSANAEAKKQKEDAEFRARAIKTFIQAGYSEESIQKLLKKAEAKQNKAESREEAGEGLERPTYIKVHRKHLATDTLDAYNLPWEWDERDNNYIIIKQWVPESKQDELFNHTLKIRERKLREDIKR